MVHELNQYICQCAFHMTKVIVKWHFCSTCTVFHNYKRLAVMEWADKSGHSENLQVSADFAEM